MAVTPVQRKKYFEARATGASIAEAARKARFSESTGHRIEKSAKKLTDTADIDSSARNYRELKIEAKLEGPKSYERLSPEAKRALEDFDYFRRRYFGRISTPWQTEAGIALVKLLESEEKEYVVMNMPPGSGKTTLLHDLMCWIICRNRAVRLITGSVTMTLAKRNLMRVRRSLERVVPELADEALLSRGLAVDAESTLAHDFGRFKPLDKELWTNEAFIVMQQEEFGAISEKEPTLSAYGMDSGFIGGRFDGCFWDDLVDPRRTRSADMKEQMQDWYQDVAESRLEPSGMMALIGQRLAADDLYRFALDMEQPLDDEEEMLDAGMTEEEVAALRSDKKYKHLIYKAHYEEKCDGSQHSRNSAPYPTGCLLDPRRLSWRDISNLMANRGERFAVVYQQEDLDPSEVLVRAEWVWGSSEHPGCIDKDRDRWDIPRGLSARDCLVIATADPSPTNFWSIQCWLYHPESGQRFLLDLIRQKMEASAFLDYNINNGMYTGVMEDWQRLSESLGFPIQYWIVESNAAQRFMLQYDYVKQWRAMRNVEIIPHNTNAVNKTDEVLGVTVLQSHYRFGRVRLPGRGEGKTCSMKLIDEVTKYPNGTRTDDCVMAQWFLEWNLPNLYLPKTGVGHTWRPTWVKQARLNSNLRL
jgi:hypothetical protein